MVWSSTLLLHTGVQEVLGHGLGWLLYVTLTIIPTTVLYIIVVIFCVSVTSLPLNAFVLLCHLTVYTFRLQPDLYLLSENEAMLALCGLWNLDFICPIVPPFCVSPNMTNLHAFALEYIEAFYPLILKLLSYICIKLHAYNHNFRPVVLLFQGQYKDGTNGTRDFRMVSALYLIFRIGVLLSYSDRYQNYGGVYSWATGVVVCFCASLFFAIVRPYKVHHLNTIDSLLLALLSIQALISLLGKHLPNQRYRHVDYLG